MKRKVSLFVSLGLFSVLCFAMFTANSRTQAANAWYHYEPAACLVSTENGDLVQPVCHNPMMDGPCDIQKVCGGILNPEW